MNKKPLLIILLSVLFSNGIVYLLHSFELSAFFIFAGFRFHIAAVLPGTMLLAFYPGALSVLKHKIAFWELLKPLIIALITGGGVIGLYLGGYFIYNKPEYFYELGMTSVTDIPVYIFWNLLQLSCLFIVAAAIKEYRYRYLFLFLFSLLFFAGEFGADKNYFTDIPHIACYISGALLVSLIALRSGNFAVFSVRLYVFLWLPLLLFGTDSPLLVKMLFAKTYSSWEGFFSVKKIPGLYPVSAAFLLEALLLFLWSLREKSPKRNLFAQ